ncbi:hypothetical protein BSN85_31855 [Bradyrhizobium brasilense]|uniref:hypothetical protein n=1 Tax=Bradyrhizobium brasilense TaxID=1419277 RepID=UPI0009770DF2|nr:hypothetical protein [Bradyrhizobium brasilense]OMI01607.1 hypothetical protein BSN85_31855 [Bradyrhizobium brasilense]
MTLDWGFVLKVLPSLFEGGANSAIALTVGLLLAILESVSIKRMRIFLRFWLELFPGVPSLVILYFVLYALPAIPDRRT